MAIRKFEKKKEKSPLFAAKVFVIFFVFVAIISIFLIRFFTERADPFTDRSDTEFSCLSFSLEMGGEKHYYGEPVSLVLKVKNKSDKPVDIDFPYSKEVNFLVYREDDWFFFKTPTLIWQSFLYDKAVPKPHKTVLMPNESKSFNGVWPQEYQDGKKVSPGVYRIVAKVTASDFTVSLRLKGKSER
ncbi:MAG: hypothetical protein MJ234_01100 [bacterium]|nr:hypothetical protein [bacterium]